MFALGACAELGRGDPIEEVSFPDAADTRDGGAETVPGDGTVADATEEIGEEIDVVEPLSFADDGVFDMINRRCASIGCHESGAGGYSVVADVDADYQATLDRVVPGDALGSLLIRKATNAVTHGGGLVLSEDTPDYELLVAWIDDGAEP